MKKIMKKIGIFAIIVGILSPFVSLPSVSAATGDCDHYLNQYFFLDETSGGFWDHYTEDDGYSTFTSFLYTFPSIAEGQVLNITSVEPYDIYTTSELETAQDKYEALLDADDSVLENVDIYGTADAYKYSSGDYKEITQVLHGSWARLEDDELSDAGHNADKEALENDSTLFKKYTIQAVLEGNNKSSSKIGVSFTEGILNTNANGYETIHNYDSNMKSYFQMLTDGINGVSGDPIGERYIVTSDMIDTLSNNDKYFNIGIRRTIDDDVLYSNNIIFGECGTDGKCYAYSEGKGITSASNITNSYAAWEAFKADKSEGKANWHTNHSLVEVASNVIDFDLSKKYYWPVILNVEYDVCNTSSTPAQWTLTYDDNVDDNTVTNMPDPISEEANVGTGIKVSSTTPKRNGYTFQKWCTESNGSGNCYKAGDEVPNTTTTKLTLFAQWGKEGTENNPKQGVISYVIGFAAVGIIAGGIYLISKKKNLFKQI